MTESTQQSFPPSPPAAPLHGQWGWVSFPIEQLGGWLDWNAIAVAAAVAASVGRIVLCKQTATMSINPGNECELRALPQPGATKAAPAAAVELGCCADGG